MSADNYHKTRERFAGPLAIGGLVAAGLLLLLVLYPEKSLLKLLENPEVSSPAQQRYLEALLHLRNGETELLIPLVRSYLAAGCTEKAAAALSLQRGRLSAEQFKTVMVLQYELRRQELEWVSLDEPGWENAQQNYAAQIEKMHKAGATPQELARYLADARRLGDGITVQKLEALLGSDADTASAEVAAAIALGKGDYRGAAAFCFKGMQVAQADQKRRLFLAGVGALQSGNLVQEALVAAEMNLTSDLAKDRGILKYLVKLSLAANRPDKAQLYVRIALGYSSDVDKARVQP
ncbi:MAG: hypothetical protein OEL57_00845 [Trichlorobacter sp.]|uniref:hypothetical protein n=1 Tax=Trichlorobacter sp. TaxID=2911007 RepID=UPI00256CB7FC|nr:hypothetical protein [Trichlorobacter sp.]MDK9716437.1 hypothetical protein [Trichlorobacter sp.]